MSNFYPGRTGYANNLWKVVSCNGSHAWPAAVSRGLISVQLKGNHQPGNCYLQFHSADWSREVKPREHFIPSEFGADGSNIFPNERYINIDDELVGCWIMNCSDNWHKANKIQSRWCGMTHKFNSNGVDFELWDVAPPLTGLNWRETHQLAIWYNDNADVDFRFQNAHIVLGTDATAIMDFVVGQSLGDYGRVDDLPAVLHLDADTAHTWGRSGSVEATPIIQQRLWDLMIENNDRNISQERRDAIREEIGLLMRQRASEYRVRRLASYIEQLMAYDLPTLRDEVEKYNNAFAGNTVSSWIKQLEAAQAQMSLEDLGADRDGNYPRLFDEEYVREYGDHKTYQLDTARKCLRQYYELLYQNESLETKVNNLMSHDEAWQFRSEILTLVNNKKARNSAQMGKLYDLLVDFIDYLRNENIMPEAVDTGEAQDSEEGNVT